MPFGGLVNRRERWGLTFRGWIVALLFFGSLGFLFVWRIEPFLAVTDRESGDLLVVEGWIPEYALKECVAEFRSHPYRLICTVGGQAPWANVPADYDDTYAHAAAGRMKRLGIDPTKILNAPSGHLDLDRTYGSAITLRHVLETKGVPVKKMTVVTVGPHARRSRLLFQKAFGGDVTVGVLALPNEEYDQKKWWRFSEGLKDVVSEFAAYLYARFLFYPSQDDSTP